MQSSRKRIVTMLLVIAMLAALIPVVRTEVQAAGLSLDQLKTKYPNGSYWNHYVNNTSEAADHLAATRDESFSENLTTTRCYDHPATQQPLTYYVGKYDCNYFDLGLQCCGFARKLAYDAYGTRASGWSTSSTVKPGDVVWFKSSVTDSTYGHWVFVYAVSGTSITVGECNVGSNRCQIRWGHTYNMSSFYEYKIYSAPYTLPETSAPVDKGDDFYGYIINTSRWKHLTDDGDNVTMRTETGDQNQIWFFDRQSDGSYVIYSGPNGNVLSVDSDSSASKANVLALDYTGSDGQQWIISGKSAKYVLRAKCTDCVLDVADGATADGTNIWMWTPNGTDAQLFQIWPLAQYTTIPVVTSDRSEYNHRERVTIQWTDVMGAGYYRHVVCKLEDGALTPVYEQQTSDTAISFTPADAGEYVSYVEVIRDTGVWKSEPCYYTVTSRNNPFTDVPVGSFYEEPVLWALANGITTGATADTFNPNGKCLRAQVVTFLHRAAEKPEPTVVQNPFTDVKETDFFYKPVLWAVEKGITNGVSADKFGSYDVCNRAAVVTFLWRAAGSPEPESTANPFADVKTSDFFYKSVLWAVENGITNGVSATEFGPTAACNRAQVVTFLYRAYN